MSDSKNPPAMPLVVADPIPGKSVELRLDSLEQSVFSLQRDVSELRRANERITGMFMEIQRSHQIAFARIDEVLLRIVGHFKAV
jgi:hypothetical protein